MANNEQKGLPISAMIAAPLQGAAEASLSLAEATANYINDVGFEKGGPNEGLPRQVDFNFERPRQSSDGEVHLEAVHIQVPLLAIAPPPNLQIDSVDVDFNLEIRAATRVADDRSKNGRSDITEHKIELHGAVSSHREQTRATDSSSKFHFQLHASNHGVPEALARVIDIMAASVAPQTSTPSDIAPDPGTPNDTTDTQDRPGRRDHRGRLI